MYTPLPLIFQIRDNCIICYSDFSYIPKKANEKTEEKRIISNSGTYTESAKKRFKKYLDIWTYTNNNLNNTFSFVTLTLSSKYKIETDYNKHLKTFLEKIEYRYKNINYAWKLELQQNGNPHYHIIFDKPIEWKIVRKQWNKIQAVHVDEYQLKMKEKYKNGYYYDTTMLNSDNTIVNEETQLKRYKIGYKANWRNPNSTDVKLENNLTAVKKYISKYITKTESNNENNNYTSNRWCGTSDTLKLIRFPQLPEELIKQEDINTILKSEIKKIEENNQIKCIIYQNIQLNSFAEIVEKTLKENREILKYNSTQLNDKLIQKEIRQYNQLFEK